MSGETEQNVSGWTTDTLRSHLWELIGNNDKRYEQRFVAQEQAVNNALTSAKEAVAKAENATEKRFDAVNEFRAQLADQARDFMPRKEAEIQIATLMDKVAALTGTRSQGANAVVGYMVGALSFIALLVTVGIAIATHH